MQVETQFEKEIKLIFNNKIYSMDTYFDSYYCLAKK